MGRIILRRILKTEDMEWIHWAQNKNQYLTLASTVMKVWASDEAKFRPADDYNFSVSLFLRVG
jgi:hypothetical protein